MPPSVAAQKLRSLVRPPVTTLVGVAKAVGVSAEAVRRWTIGETRPSAETRQKLFEAFGISPKSWDRMPKPKASEPANDASTETDGAA